MVIKDFTSDANLKKKQIWIHLTLSKVPSNEFDIKLVNFAYQHMLSKFVWGVIRIEITSSVCRLPYTGRLSMNTDVK